MLAYMPLANFSAVLGCYLKNINAEKGAVITNIIMFYPVLIPLSYVLVFKTDL
jgi:Na+-driven multidrug efflux pump